MKRFIIQLIVAALIGAAGWLVFMPDRKATPDAVVPREHTEEIVVEVEPPAQDPAPPKPLAPIVKAAPPPAPKPAAKPKRSVAERRRRQWIRQSEMMAKRFDQLTAKLAAETDAVLREKLIQQIAHHVRFNTLDTLDWVTTLDEPQDQRAALEAINKNALVGIGARIEPDEQGYPRIQETTLLGAVESSGQTQPGDVIRGYVTPDGETISFQGKPMREVAGQLRGEAGTEVRLLMTRPAADGSAAERPGPAAAGVA